MDKKSKPKKILTEKGPRDKMKPAVAPENPRPTAAAYKLLWIPADNKRPTLKISDDNKPPTSEVAGDNKRPTAQKTEIIKSADKSNMLSPSDIMLMLSDDNPLPTNVTVECLTTLNYVLPHPNGKNIKFKVAPDIPRPTRRAVRVDETANYFLNLKDGRTFRLTMVSSDSLSSAKGTSSGG